MPVIQQLARYAQTAQAAYAENLIAGEANKQAYVDDAEMSASKASRFDGEWTVLAQSPFAFNGFPAVLLQSATTGEKVLAIAGTDASSATDLWANAAYIARAGDLDDMQQFQDLEAFYQQLISNGRLGPAEQFVVTGHSLGGFLAQAFTARHDAVVSAAYTCNAPGYGGVRSQLLDVLGIVDDSIANAKITNVKAKNGISVTSSLGVMLGSTIEVRVEAATLPTSNHSIARLADSLAVQGLLAKLDPAITQDTLNQLLLTSSNAADGALESLLDAAWRLLLGPSISATPTGDERDALYANLKLLDDSSAVTGLAGKVTIQAPGAALVNEARGNFAALLALESLSPIVLAGKSAADQDALNTALSTVHSTLFGWWNSDKNLSAADRAAGKARFSDAWLADRTAMLLLLTTRNESD
ncbi:MAG: hypothetical protein IT480_02735, partial [Gammaproteobacteria bacterium]|nr:hypothetical protein [Gammaproteobacteria bacterium]